MLAAKGHIDATPRVTAWDGKGARPTDTTARLSLSLSLTHTHTEKRDMAKKGTLQNARPSDQNDTVEGGDTHAHTSYQARKEKKRYKTMQIQLGESGIFHQHRGEGTQSTVSQVGGPAH